MKTVRRLINFAENNFQCVLGEPRASILIDDVCVPYVVYAAQSKLPIKLEQWLLQEVFAPLLEKGGCRLYWRSEEKIDLSSDEEMYRIWMRVAVLDKSGSQVRLEDRIKPEGEKMREVA